MRAGKVLLCTILLQCSRGLFPTMIDTRLSRIHRSASMKPEFTRPSAERGMENPFPVPNSAERKHKKAAKPRRHARAARKRCFCHFGGEARARKPLPARNLEGPSLHVLMPACVWDKGASLASLGVRAALALPWEGGLTLSLPGSGARRCRVENTKHETTPSISRPSKPAKKCSSARVILHAAQCRIRGELGSRWSLLRCACLSSG